MTPHFNLLDEKALETPGSSETGRRRLSGRHRAETLTSHAAGHRTPSDPGRGEASLSQYDTDAEQPRKSHVWLWVLFLIALAVGLVYFMYFQPALTVEHPWPEFQISPVGLVTPRRLPFLFLNDTGRDGRSFTLRFQTDGCRRAVPGRMRPKPASPGFGSWQRAGKTV